MKPKMFSTLLSFIILSTFSCRPSVSPNEWVVSTGTCWNTMSVTKAGSSIPRTLTTCDRVVILPATELSADLKVETKFRNSDNRVSGTIQMTYNWRITDPVKFISSAKSVVTTPTDTDYKVSPNTIESVENSVVDKMLADLIREYTPTKDAIDIDELSLENEIAKLSKDKIDRGIEFSNISLNVTFSPQIEEALDVISAIEFYEKNGEGAFGRQIMLAKAAASKVSNTTNIQQPPQVQE